MKKLLLPLLMSALLMSCALTAHAEGPVFDPTITPTKTIVCNYPIEREDGAALALNEIAQVNFYVSPTIGAGADWREAGSNTSACQQVYDLTQIPDGQYYYTVTATDTAGRQSIYSANAPVPEYAAFVVKRISNPGHPTGISILP